LLALAFDTSSPVLTIAVSKDGEVIDELTTWLPRGHMARLIPEIDTLMAASGLRLEDLGVIVTGSGPGSYTGLRIGMMMAKTFAQLLDIPIIGIASMDAIAYRNAKGNAVICPVIDAKRGEVYTSFYRIEDQSLERVTSLRALTPEDLSELIIAEGLEDVILAGDALKLYSDVFKKILGDKVTLADEDDWWPKASDLIHLAERRIDAGEFDELFHLAPIYIRLSQAEEMWEKRHQG